MSRQDRSAMPSMVKLARFHDLYDMPPHCFRCKERVPAETWAGATGWLDRAHVIDRWCGGPDGARNLRPLCLWCHKRQPIFKPGQEAEALDWFMTPASALEDMMDAMIWQQDDPACARNTAEVLQLIGEDIDTFADSAEAVKRLVMSGKW